MLHSRLFASDALLRPQGSRKMAQESSKRAPNTAPRRLQVAKEPLKEAPEKPTSFPLGKIGSLGNVGFDFEDRREGGRIRDYHRTRVHPLVGEPSCQRRTKRLHNVTAI